MNQLLSSILIPETIDDIIGQKHLVGSNCIIQKMIEKKVIYSLIFFGLPGIGKTSLAFVICKQLKLKHFYFNPTKNTKQDLENILNKISNTKKIVIIIDEIHRMNKDKQDILLPYLEKNNLIIIATTTENPYFVVNPAIRSRCFILEFKPISIQEMEEALHKICSKFNMSLTSEQINKIVAEQPDLLFLHFGINDLGSQRAAIAYADDMESIILDIQNKLPNCDIILLSPFAPNSVLYDYDKMQEYVDYLKGFEETYDHVQLIDVFKLSLEMTKNKKYLDMSGNGINHVNDFASRVYLQAILSTMYDYSNK